MDIGGRGDKAVDRPAFPVHSPLDLYAEVVSTPRPRGGGGVDYLKDSLPEVDFHEAPHGFFVVEGFFRGRVAQVEPALQKMDPEHPLQTDGRTAFSRSREKGFDEEAE